MPHPVELDMCLGVCLLMLILREYTLIHSAW